MLNKIKHVIANTPNGTNQWRDHLNALFAEFAGNALNPRKADAAAAKSLGLKNANTYWAISDQATPEEARQALEERLKAICNRKWDNNYGEGYFDFFVPVFKARDVYSEDPRKPYIWTGIWTTVHVDEEGPVTFTQTLKRYSEDLGEYSEGAITKGPTGGGRISFLDQYNRENTDVHVDQLELDGLLSISELLGDDVLKKIPSLSGQHGQANSATCCKILREVQSREYDRITAAIGVVPRLKWDDYELPYALFAGEIRIEELLAIQ